MEIWNDLICPKCGGEKWQLGPKGGNSQNIRCECGYRLNVCRLPDGRWWVEDISKKDYVKSY